MKFAKVLQAEEIPEWEEYYLDYKLGKKKVKAVKHAVRQLPNLQSANATDLRLIQEIDRNRAVFLTFLRGQLTKIDDFYRAQEREAERRTSLLREQLETYANDRPNPHPQPPAAPAPVAETKPSPIRQRLTKTLREQWAAAYQAFGQGSTWVPHDAERDYTWRPERMPPHRVAARKLKTAMQEEYRHLEKIRAFADMNRTAFRKIIKKYKKETRQERADTRLTHLEQQINSARFADSDEIEDLFDEYERLYAEHFEKDNRKAAASKLRTKHVKPMQYVGPAARASFACGAAIVLGIMGLYAGVRDLYGPAPFSGQAPFLLQLYGGVALLLVMAFLFIFACAVFEEFRVNYGFIFQLDPKSQLHWSQMAELAAYPFLWLGVVMALNFAYRAGGETMYTFWFVVLIIGMAVILGPPVPVFYHKARLWLLFTLGRQFVPLFITVEFRDFFGGDILCSLTYALGNLFLFGCLYGAEWASPSQCSSSHHYGIGVLTCIPATIRALQCLKRYTDERKAFPHLPNFGKYCFTICQYAALCVYRLNVTKDWTLAVFAVVASITSIYCIVWDIQYDWSLGNPSARRWGLRDTLIFRKQYWVYYAAIVADVILRLNWIPYCIWTKDAQHASIVAFVVALSEIIRRGIWVIFRVENEQAANVERRKAVGDMKLPYKFVSPSLGRLQLDSSAAVDAATTTDTESQTTPAASTLSRIGTRMRTGHVHDYQRRPESTREALGGDSDDDEDDD